MSRYGWSSRPGLSPFNSTAAQDGIPAVSDDDFSYITSEDLENHTYSAPQSYGHHSHEPAPAFDHRRPEDDVILIKHRGITYPEHFPAYSIGDGKLFVDDVKERVKMIMDLSDRQAKGIRLYYKGRQLKESQVPIRDYNVKNNSEIMVVLGEPGSGSASDSSEEIVVVGREPGYDPPKKSRNKGRGRRRDDQSPRASGSSLGLEVPIDSGRRGTSRVRTQSPSSLSAISGASAAAAVPGGPIEKINSISAHFRAKLLPICLQYTANPPLDPKKREDEHRKISETVMQQVILKLDEVDTGGEEGARARRKELVREVQDVLKSLDEKLKV